MKLLFIVGLQKSGTSLLNRLLMLQPNVSNPFLPEGKFFWGDDPPFAPMASPCGQLYQKHQGKQGHALDRNDFRPQDLALLEQRIKAAGVDTPVLMNKNPYNTVRLDWLKTIFPQSKIVAIFRQPPANIFSLYKKYLLMQESAQNHEDWWGIKPPGWEKMMAPDKIIQASSQWTAVNQHLIKNLNHVDHLLSYADLCRDPDAQLNTILNLVGEQATAFPAEPLVCMDAEYKTGGLLESRNKTLRKTGSFGLTLNDQVEIQSLSEQQIMQIHQLTEQTYQTLLGS